SRRLTAHKRSHFWSGAKWRVLGLSGGLAVMSDRQTLSSQFRDISGVAKKRRKGGDNVGSMGGAAGVAGGVGLGKRSSPAPPRRFLDEVKERAPKRGGRPRGRPPSRSPAVASRNISVSSPPAAPMRRRGRPARNRSPAVSSPSKSP